MFKKITLKYLNKLLAYYKYQCVSIDTELSFVDDTVPENEVQSMLKEYDIYRNKCRILEDAITIVTKTELHQ